MSLRTACFIAMLLAPLGCGSARRTTDLAVVDDAVDASWDSAQRSTAKRVFVTQAHVSGAFGGVAGGDALCLAAVNAAGLGGDWKAWLSDSQTDAISRIRDVGPWYFVDQTTKVFDGIDLSAAAPLNALVNFDHDENGQPIMLDLHVWTGTLANGRRAPNTCSDWTSAVADTLGDHGTINSSTSWSYESGSSDCRFSWHLYCFEQ